MEINETAGSARIYEVGFLVNPTLTPDAAQAVRGQIEEMVTKAGGSVIDGENPRMRRLSYAIFGFINGAKHAFTEAYFGWTKFELPVEALDDLNASLKKKEEIIRFLTINTVREKTYAPTSVPEEEIQSDSEDAALDMGDAPEAPVEAEVADGETRE